MEYDIHDKHFIRKVNGGYSPCISGNNKYGIRPFEGSVLPNCVGAATGVFNIKAAAVDPDCETSCKYLGNRNAVDFTKFAKEQGLVTGQEPKEGACMVWSYGEGHVAVIDKVISDTEVETVESGWSYRAEPVLRRVTRKKGKDGRWGYSHDLICFIYQPNVGPQPEVYIVKKGDNLTKIARMYGVTVAQLVAWNNIKNPNRIYPGERIIIKEPEKVYYQVKWGDTLTKIARMYDTSVAELLRLNPDIYNPNLILVGQRVRVK